MHRDDHSAPPDTQQPSAPEFQLRFGAVFAWVTLLAFVIWELQVWVKVSAAFGFRSAAYRVLVWLYYSPQMAFRAVALGAATAVLGDLVFRLVVRPLLVRWYHPASRDPAYVPELVFFQKPGERILNELPAHRVVGRRSPAGTLIRTNHALYFCPFAWNEEPWTVPLGELQSVQTRIPRRRVLNLISGYPDHVIFRDDSSTETAFVVPDPAMVLGWFATGSGTEAPSSVAGVITGLDPIVT